MKYYRIYGLNLIANIAVPGLTAIDLPVSNIPTVDVVLGLLPSWLTQKPTQSYTSSNWYTSTTARLKSDGQSETPLLQVWKIDLDRYFYCLYQDGTTFVVSRAGNEIWATWPNDLTVEDTATYLLGPILGFVLRLQNVICLHASAISIKDRVVVLVGTAGAGKSTTAAAFAQQGYAVLSDDVVPLIDQGDTFLVQPAYPRIRLWNSSVQALYGAAEDLPRLVPTHPTWDKRYLDLNQPGYHFQSEPLPLSAIYYLNERSNDPLCPQIEPMTTQEQLVTLVANTYTNYLLDKSLRAQEFEVLSRLVRQVPVRQIIPHADIGKLPQLLNMIIEDF